MHGPARGELAGALQNVIEQQAPGTRIFPDQFDESIEPVHLGFRFRLNNAVRE